MDCFKDSQPPPQREKHGYLRQAATGLRLAGVNNHAIGNELVVGITRIAQSWLHLTWF